MDQLPRRELLRLMRKRAPGLVSIYLPTHLGGAEQDAINFRNLLTQAEQRLEATGLRAAEARKRLEPLDALAHDDVFWKQQGLGLSLLLGDEQVRRFRLERDVEPLVVVAEHFHLKPLLQILSEPRFYVLAVSQNHVRLLEGTRQAAREVSVGALPKNLAEALNYDQPEAMVQYHTGSFGGRRRQSTVFHGQGGSVDQAKDDILRYFRLIDQALSDYLEEARVPVVFAGVNYLFPIYRRANSHPGLIDTPISGNPDLLSPAQLHAHAWQVVEPVFDISRTEAAARYAELAGTQRASSDIEQVLPAAYDGRVESIFIAKDRLLWGRCEPLLRNVEPSAAQTAGSEDLLDRAAVETALRGGDVYVVPAAEVPEGNLVAAIYRYATGPQTTVNEMEATTSSYQRTE